MTLSNREKDVLDGIREWENRMYQYESNDFQLLYDKYIERSFDRLPEKVREQILSSLDSWLFHLHAFLQGSEMQVNARERILANGRVFREEIQSLEDMKTLSIDQLQYIAEQSIARHRMYSLVQGGMSGAGGVLILGADIPGMAVINLRIVQLVAITYGFEVNTPFEMMTALKVFNVSLLPLRWQQTGWKELMSDLSQTSEHYFYEGNEELANIGWVEPLINQGLKGIAITIFRKRMIQGIPLISMAIGAGANYSFTRKVSDFAHKYYQMRYLREKQGEK